MTKIVCTLPNASLSISGIEFEPIKDGIGVISKEDVPDELAATFLTIEGYYEEGKQPGLEEPSSAANTGETTSAPTPRAPRAPRAPKADKAPKTDAATTTSADPEKPADGPAAPSDDASGEQAGDKSKPAETTEGSAPVAGESGSTEGQGTNQGTHEGGEEIF